MSIIVRMQDSSYPQRQIEAVVPQEGPLVFRDAITKTALLNMSPARSIASGQQQTAINLLQNSRTRVSFDRVDLLARLQGGGSRRDIFFGGKDLAPNSSFSCETNGAGGGKVHLSTTWKFHVTVVGKARPNYPGDKDQLLHDGEFTGKKTWDYNLGRNFSVTIHNRYETSTRHISVHVEEDTGGCVIA